MSSSKKPKPIAEQFRRAIRDAAKRGVTQYRLARDAGISASQLTRLMKRESDPSLETAEKIAAALGLRLQLRQADD